MKVQLLGVKNVNFTNNNGEMVSGKNIYVAYPDENVQGLCSEKLWLRDGMNLPKDTKANDMLDLSFNSKGKIESITKA